MSVVKCRNCGFPRLWAQACHTCRVFARRVS